jgi:hypothetical protein
MRLKRIFAAAGAVLALAAAAPVAAVAKDGADDPAGHVQRGHGHDDGPNHR